MHLFCRDDLGVDCISAAGQNLLILISQWHLLGKVEHYSKFRKDRLLQTLFPMYLVFRDL